MAKTSKILEMLILGLPAMKDHHCTTSEPYNLLRQIAKHEVTQLFADSSKDSKSFEPFGQIALPYFKMGAIDSLDLFGLDELIIFSFYWSNRKRYRRVLDIGGNLGLHSIIMSRCGFDVKAFEPDPVHYEVFTANLSLNRIKGVSAIKAAVSTKSGMAEFVRVLGNTTSSHLEGSKNPYGELEKFAVKIEDIKSLIKDVDLMKMDVEGHEKEILLALDAKDWEKLDGLVEVGSKENAKAIFAHLQKIKVNAFAQKKAWKKVETLEDMPESHRDGTLFITSKKTMPWSE